MDSLDSMVQTARIVNSGARTVIQVKTQFLIQTCDGDKLPVTSKFLRHCGKNYHLPSVKQTKGSVSVSLMELLPLVTSFSVTLYGKYHV